MKKRMNVGKANDEEWIKIILTTDDNGYINMSNEQWANEWCLVALLQVKWYKYFMYQISGV